MRLIIIVSFMLGFTLHADVVMKKSKPRDDLITIPEHPIHRPPLYPRKYIPTGIIVETQSDCNQYVEMLREKDAYIKSLLSELAVLREKEQRQLSENLRKEHEAELQKFKEHTQRSIRSKNSIIIKEKADIIEKKPTKEQP